MLTEADEVAEAFGTPGGGGNGQALRVSQSEPPATSTKLGVDKLLGGLLGQVILRVATLDEDPGVRPKAHIWASHHVPWLDYGTDLPTFAEAPPPKR